MKISIKYMGSIINLPSGVIDLAKNASENELKVILVLSAYSSHFCDFDKAIPALCKQLDLTASEVTSALCFWAKNGILELDGVDNISPDTVSSVTEADNSVPSFTGAQITALIDANPSFKMLADCAANVLGKDFTPTDYNSLLHIKNYYKFSDEYILMLLAYCVENNTSNWAYIRKTSKILYDEGIDTYEKLEEHFAARRNKRSLEYKVRKLFGVGGREFTAREKGIFDAWANAKISYELIKMAYEISVDNGKGANWNYANKILENWLASGVKTVEDAQRLMESHKEKLSMSSFDTDDFFEAALKRSSERIKERSKK
ncbi:MAG: DnaD domain protein [Ruminococcaceae bacterium]|nr:DnaD domain protein [Oscillospiraceae bacterium]